MEYSVVHTFELSEGDTIVYDGNVLTIEKIFTVIESSGILNHLYCITHYNVRCELYLEYEREVYKVDI